MYSTSKKWVTVQWFLALSLSLATGLLNTSQAFSGDSRSLDTSRSFADMIDRVKPAVVHVSVKKVVDDHKDDARKSTEEEFFNNSLITEFFGDQQRRMPQGKTDKRAHYGHGSGFVISPDGYILTNAHVVAKAESITVLFPDKRSRPAKIIGTDPLSDVALLRVDGHHLPVVTLGNSDSLRVGDWAIAIGSPFEAGQTVTAGIISATGRSSIGISEYEDFIQTDAAINPGNSGGPLLNSVGQVIGINTAFLTQTGGYMGIGFAIPVNMAKSVADQLKKNGRMVRAWLGVALKDISPDVLIQEKLPADAINAALVHAIEADSPAAKSSLQKDDLIVSFDGRKIQGAADLRNRVALSPPGSIMKILFFRKGKQQETTVRLATARSENLRNQ